MPQAIEELGKQFIQNPVKVEVAPQSTTAERVEQCSIFINQAEKQALLTILLREGWLEEGAPDRIDRTIVFTRTKHGADRVVRFLTPAGSRPPPSMATSRRPSAPPPSRASATARSRCWSPPTLPRAGSTFRAFPTCSTLKSPMWPSNMFTASAAPRAPAPMASPSA
jgi:hypothetical protein